MLFWLIQMHLMHLSALLLFEGTEAETCRYFMCVLDSAEETKIEYTELQNKLPNTSHLGNFYN